MKILPDYLIEMMPALEEALEELRLSVIDHAYELLKCLDVDELSSDTIRRKLELYDLKIDNMTEEWLPNGKFYRMYPEIKHNRTRLNSLKSVVCSGGQFEGLWSNEFIKEAEHNYNKIRTLRHYSVQSEYDGYFYVSGNVNRVSVSGSDLVENSTLTALSTDILLGQAMPAGYTYLYVPWPRPAYPADAGYFYNVNMLNADRLHYAINCDTTDSYDESKPASLNYDWKNGTNTPWRTPYWFDYHYMDDTNHTDPIEPQLETDDRYAGTWPIHEKGEYGNYNEDGQWIQCNPKDAHFYRLDSSCSELSNSNAIFPTKCYIRSSNRTTHPNDSQIFVPKRFEGDIEDTIFTIDSGNVDDITKEHTSNPDNFIYGTYRWDHLFDKGFQIIQEMSHIKTYKPIWSESSPIFAMMQSNFNSGLHPEEIAEHSFYNWFELKQQKNIILPEESTIRDNNPSISEITHTSYDRSTGAHITVNSMISYTRGDAQQGFGKYIASDYTQNNLFEFGVGIYTDYNCELEYDLISVHAEDLISYSDNLSSYIIGNPITRKMYLNLNSDTHDYLSYITYKTSSIHKLWFSADKSNKLLDGERNLLFNKQGSNELYLIEDLTKDIDFSVIGFYDENNNVIEYNSNTRLKLEYLDPENLEKFTIKSNELYNEEVGVIVDIYYKLDFNGTAEWKVADDPEDSWAIAKLNNYENYTIFKSFSNNGIANSTAEMGANINVYSRPVTLTFNVANCAEIGCDYLQVYVDSYDTVSYSFMNDSLDQSSPSTGQWHSLQITLETGSHFVRFVYRKDNSVNSRNDCSYLAVLTSEINKENDYTYSSVYLDNITVYKEAAYVLFNTKLIDLVDPPVPPPKIIEQYGLMLDNEDINKVELDFDTIGQPMLLNTAELEEAEELEFGYIREPVSTTIILGEESHVDGEPLYIEGPYYYMYNFNAGSTTNLYFSAGSSNYDPKYSEHTILATIEPSENLPPTSNYSDILLQDDNGDITSCANSGITIRINNWPLDSADPPNPEIYMSGWNGYINDRSNCAALVLIDESQQTIFTKSIYKLPSNLYEISGDNLNWNTDHILYNMLYGKPVIVWYIPNGPIV